MSCVKYRSLDLSQLEVNDHLNSRSSREVHAYDSKALLQVRLGAQVVEQLCVDAQSHSAGVRKHASSTAVRKIDLGQVSCRSSLQVVIHTLPFVLHMQECGYLQGTGQFNNLKA